MRVVSTVEARMSSTRLPGKTLLDLLGKPVLYRVVERIRRSVRVDEVVVATTTNPADDVIETYCRQEDIHCYRGSEDDVLGRVVEAQQAMDSTIVVEVCGDTPLLDPVVIDLAVEAFEADMGDLITTARQASFPQGIDADRR